MRAAEHCPVSILQARGGDAIPEVALWAIDRFVRLLSAPAVELPQNDQHRGAQGWSLELGTGTGPYGACWSTQYCVAVLSRWAESSTRLGGFRALKNTLAAPYTTKVNYL